MLCCTFNYFYGDSSIITVGVQVDLPESAADSLPDDQEPLTISIILREKYLFKNIKVGLIKLFQKF